MSSWNSDILFLLYWKIRQPARYTSSNPHREPWNWNNPLWNQRGSILYLFSYFFWVISMFATCPLSPCPQCSRTHFHGDFFTGLLGRRHCQGCSACDCECLSLALVQMVLAWTLTMPISWSFGTVSLPGAALYIYNCTINTWIIKHNWFALNHAFTPSSTHRQSTKNEYMCTITYSFVPAGVAVKASTLRNSHRKI